MLTCAAIWLGRQDSNLRYGFQRPVSYHLTTPQYPWGLSKNNLYISQAILSRTSSTKSSTNIARLRLWFCSISSPQPHLNLSTISSKVIFGQPPNNPSQVTISLRYPGKKISLNEIMIRGHKHSRKQAPSRTRYPKISDHHCREMQQDRKSPTPDTVTYRDSVPPQPSGRNYCAGSPMLPCMPPFPAETPRIQLNRCRSSPQPRHPDPSVFSLSL